jgi:Restriction endonuclease
MRRSFSNQEERVSSKKAASKATVKSGTRKQAARKVARLASKSTERSPTKKATANKARKLGAKKAATPQWQQYERLIAKIHRQLAPDAEVTHNRQIMGVSGRRRQIDVLISQEIGNLPIRIVLECKRYTRPVTIDRVEAFVQKLRDIRASLGVMISPQGFDAGARAVAAQKGVILKAFRDAQETDWGQFIEPDNWMALTSFEIQDLRAFARLADSGEEVELPLGAPMSVDGNEGTLNDLFFSLYEQHRPLPNIGLTSFTAELSERGQMSGFGGQGKAEISHIVFRCNIRAKKHLISKLLGGQILESVENEGDRRAETITFVIDKEDILQNQPGIDLTPEDYQRERQVLTQFDISRTKRFIQAGITKNRS